MLHVNVDGRGQRPWTRKRSTIFLAGALGAVVATGALLAPSMPVSAQQRAAVVPIPGAPATFADLVERVRPSVVSVKVASGSGPQESRRWPPGNRGGPRFGQGRGAPAFPDLPPDHPLNELFKNLPPEFRGGPNGRPGQPGRPRVRRSQGSGFVISEDGYVVTNNHVVSGGNEITVSFDDKENLPAEIVGTDSRTDLALLKIKTKRKFQFVQFATKPNRVGDWVMAVGNPFGLGGTVTVGVLSALSRNIGSGPYDYLQIDAAVNRGNSGGPTFNLNGEVIGINTAIYSPSGGNVGIAFAVPADTASAVIEQLKKSGSVQRGWLGVKIQTISEDIAAGLGQKEA
ncbi:MAG TPA: trypsin-like peptidase domain-containing protein, partial [Hyphomicrobiaceae bacterium]|nr:trypsin-like peptidase domain-containing protein [Hyphomicrobiaceae bacterium]